MKTTLLALVTCAAAAAQNHSLSPNLVSNGGFDASGSSIAPWVPGPPPPWTAQLKVADFVGDGSPSLVLQFAGGEVQQPINLAVGKTYLICWDVGWLRIPTDSVCVHIQGQVGLRKFSGFDSAWARDPGDRMKNCLGVEVTSLGGSVWCSLNSRQGNLQQGTVDNVEVREMLPGSLRVEGARCFDRATAVHSIEIQVDAGQGNPAVLLVSPARGNRTLPGLVGTVLVDLAQSVTVDAGVNLIGDSLPLGVSFQEPILPTGLGALYWQPFVLDVAAGVVRAADVALAWSYQR